MKKVPSLRDTRDPFSYGHLPLYLYLVRAYSKFLVAGRCLDFPLVLQIQTQSFCNGRCSTCPYPILSQKLSQGKMTWELFAKIANESVSEPLLSSVTFDLHNEPLLDARIFNWVQYFKSINRNKLCDLVTNGQLLDSFNLTDMMGSNIDLVKVSLNAHSKETYQVMNEGLDYDKVMKNISYLLSNGYMAQRLVLSFVLTGKNVHEVYQATRYWNERGVSTRVIGITNRAGSLKDYQRFKLKTGYRGSPLISRIRQNLMSRIRRVIGCHLPFYQMNILFNGDAIICCHDWARATVVGNIKNNTLREVWNSKKMNEVRQLMLKKRYQQLDSCNGCSMVNRSSGIAYR